MVHDSFANRLPLLAFQSGKQAVAVLSGILRELHAGDFRGGSHQIGEAAQLSAHRARLDLPWPARQERNPMPGIPDVGLLAPPVGVARCAKRALSSGFQSAPLSLVKMTSVLPASFAWSKAR